MWNEQVGQQKGLLILNVRCHAGDVSVVSCVLTKSVPKMGNNFKIEDDAKPGQMKNRDCHVV